MNGTATESCRHGYWYDPESGYDSTLVTDVSDAVLCLWCIYLPYLCYPLHGGLVVTRQFLCLSVQFELTCERAWLVEMSMTVKNIGTTFGVVFTFLSDKLGRWRVLLLACVSNTLVALLQALSVNMTMYTVLAFFDGITEQVSNLCAHFGYGLVSSE